MGACMANTRGAPESVIATSAAASRATAAMRTWRSIRANCTDRAPNVQSGVRPLLGVPRANDAAMR